ncbi:MAG: TfoX/Sxy family protein [Anaerolineales bacterium]
MASLVSLRNIGPKSAQWLKAVGIQTAEDFYEVGVVESYRRAKSAYPGKVSVNMLYALQGALLDIPWNDLPPDMREMLRIEAGEV